MIAELHHLVCLLYVSEICGIVLLGIATGPLAFIQEQQLLYTTWSEVWRGGMERLDEEVMLGQLCGAMGA